MDSLHLDLPQLFALAAAIGFASGIRLYLLLLALGGAAYFGWAVLPEGLHVLAHPFLLVCLIGLTLLEFVADKLPWFDSVWDTVHTFVRLPAGAALAAGLAGGQNDALTVVLALLGGGFAAGSHFAKAGTRAVVNASPEPLSNILLSLGEDVACAVFVWLTLTHPLLAGAIAVVSLILALLLIRFLWRGLRRLFLRSSLAAPQLTPLKHR